MNSAGGCDNVSVKMNGMRKFISHQRNIAKKLKIEDKNVHILRSTRAT